MFTITEHVGGEPFSRAYIRGDGTYANCKNIAEHCFTYLLQQIDSQSTGKLTIHWHHKAYYKAAYTRLKGEENFTTGGTPLLPQSQDVEH